MITVKMTFGDLEFNQVAEARELVEKRLGKKITLEQLLLMLAFAYSVTYASNPTKKATKTFAIGSGEIVRICLN